MQPLTFWNSTGLAMLLALLTVTARADIVLKPEVNDGDRIADVARIVVRVESEEGIDKVEFRVGDELRYTDESVPYVFEWDTIKDPEGPHTLSITAYDSAGATRRITLNLIIDNELDQGADALAQRAQEALRSKNTADAIRYSRRALKAEEGNLLACRTMAGVHAAARDWKKAIAVLQGAKGLETSAVALSELASYRVQQALLPDNVANFFADFSAARDLYRRAADLVVVEQKKRGAENVAAQAIALGDALMAAGRYREAVNEYARSARQPDAPLSLVNRLALAYAMDDRLPEAQALVRPLIRAKKDDPATRATLALALLRTRQFAEARSLVEPDLAAQVPAALIIAAYADAALGNRRTAVAFARDAVGLLPESGDARYALALSATEPRESLQAIERTLALAPLQNGPLLDYAARLLLTRRQDRIEQALNLTDLALKNEPENLNARLMQALLYLAEKRLTEAEPLLTWAQRKDGKAPDVLMALAIYWDLKDNGPMVSRLLTAAKEADPRFERQTPDTPLELIVALNRRLLYRAGFFLLPSTLYPEGSPGDATR